MPGLSDKDRQKQQPGGQGMPGQEPPRNPEGGVTGKPTGPEYPNLPSSHPQENPSRIMDGGPGDAGAPKEGGGQVGDAGGPPTGSTQSNQFGDAGGPPKRGQHTSEGWQGQESAGKPDQTPLESNKPGAAPDV